MTTMEESSTDDGDFEDYEITAFDPGWNFTYIIVGICILVNLILPIMLCCSQKKTEKTNTIVHDGAIEESSVVSSQPELSDRVGRSIRQKWDHDTNKDGESTCSELSQGSVISMASSIALSVASKVLDVRSNKNGHHRQHKRGRRRNGQKGAILDSVDVGNDTPPPTTTRDDDALLVQDDEPLTPAQQFIEEFAMSSTWDKEMRKIVSLWIPYSISGAAEGISQTVIIGIVSHFVGLKEANAFVVVTILVEFTSTLTYGFSEAIGVLGPQADGVGNNLLVGRYMQLGLIFYTIGSIPGLAIWTFFTKDAVLWFGFDEETANIAQEYAYPFLAATFFHATGEVLDSYLEIKGHERFSMWVELGGTTIETLAVLAMAMLGVKNMFIIGTVQAVLDLLLTILTVVYVVYKGWLDDCWEGLARTSGLKDKKAVKNMLTTGIPLGISWMMTYGEWEIMTIFASHMGPAEVAAWGIVGFVWDTFEYIIDGLADASEVRVGFRMGAGDVRKAKESAYKGMYLGVVVSVYASGILLTISTYLVQWLTPDPTLQRLIFDLLPLIAFGQVSMSVGMVCWNILGAQGRVRVATLIEFAVSWLIVMPMAAILVYVYNFNLSGMVGPLDVGYTLGGVTITYLLITSDWQGLSREVISRNGGNISYDEYDWDELPPKIQTAATVLGYTRAMWDEGEEPASSDKDWAKLSAMERKAGEMLGYDEIMWDDHDSKETEGASTYDDYDWHELPVEVQKAARVLGYTSSMWDSDKEPKTCEKDWGRLTSEERESASKLGYDQSKWEGGKDSGRYGENDGPTKARTKVTESTSVSYNDLDWDDLPADVQKAAKILGYTARMWDDDREPKSSDKDWKELTAAEQEAAEKLGHNQLEWDSDGDSAPVVHYNDLTWRKLPVDAQEAAEVLGYTPKMWNNDQEPDTCDKDWNELTLKEREAALKLGYDKKKWKDESEGKELGCDENSRNDGGSDNNAADKSASKALSHPSSSKLWDDFDWDELPDDIKKAARVLGFTAKIWDTNKEPKSSDKDWKELTAAEQEAAEKLGHNQLEWDSDGDSAPVVNYDDSTWRKLHVDAQEAAKVLGYTPKMWNNDQEPDTCDKDWDDLTSKEQEAALKLGYDKKRWENGYIGKNNDDLKWHMLPVGVKEAAKVLGYTPEMWYRDHDPDTCDKLWGELSSDEREAATRLGYTKIKWNGESKSHATTSMVKKEAASVLEGTSGGESDGANANVDSDENHATNSDDYTWRKLPAAIQEAATTIGYTPRLWNKNQEPSTCNKNWRDLTSDERKAAKILGYNELKWEGDSEFS